MKNSQKFVISVLSNLEICEFDRKEFCGFHVNIVRSISFKNARTLEVLADSIYSTLQMLALDHLLLFYSLSSSPSLSYCFFCFCSYFTNQNKTKKTRKKANVYLA
jgi:hypothetical protein